MRCRMFWPLRHIWLTAAVGVIMAQWTLAAWGEPRLGQGVRQPAAQDAPVTAAEEAPRPTASADPAAEPPRTIPKRPTLAPKKRPAAPADATPKLTSGDSAGSASDSESTDGSTDGSGTLRVIIRAGSTDEPSETAPETSADEPSAAAEAPADESPAPASEASAEEPLEPIPDPGQFGPVAVETASFNGVTPGITTLAEMQESWGPSVQIVKREGMTVRLYRVEPFDQVEVSFFGDVAASIVIRLDRSFPANTVAEQLELSNIRPVYVSNALGEILGQSFPERGVMFAFTPSTEPRKPTMQVAQIIIEPVSAEPFLLRAETYLDTHLELSAADLEQAIKLDPSNSRAHWLRSRALAAMGDLDAAVKAGAEAVRLNPADPQYRVTHAQILGQAGHFAEGIEQAKKALATSDKRPHIKARAQCLLGDLLSSGPHPDYKQAIEYHTKAIDTAEPLVNNQHPAIRLAASEVLINAHLGAAHDIAWGNWNQKEIAVSKWLGRAAKLVDELIENEDQAAEHRFRIACRAVAACVGAEGRIDPIEWTDETIVAAERLIASAEEPFKARKVRRDLGMALYDAVQVYQMRGEHDLALKYGQRAITHLEQVAATGQSNPADSYLLGRLYFRLGAIHAVGKQDHQAAIPWFEKAVAVFDRTSGQITPPEFGRLGETLVSMGVSYWETGQHEKATGLTQRGVELIEQAVKNGSLAESALEIPYSNLATMHRSLGDNEQADRFLQKASRHRNTMLK